MTDVHYQNASGYLATERTAVIQHAHAPKGGRAHPRFGLTRLDLLALPIL
jgi:hypothetical protein